MTIIITQKGIDFMSDLKKSNIRIPMTKEIHTLQTCIYGEPPYIHKTSSLKEEFEWLIQTGYAKRYLTPEKDN